MSFTLVQQIRDTSRLGKSTVIFIRKNWDEKENISMTPLVRMARINREVSQTFYTRHEIGTWKRSERKRFSFVNPPEDKKEEETEVEHAMGIDGLSQFFLCHHFYFPA